MTKFDAKVNLQLHAATDVS